jgi:hypothetical protein
MGVIPQKTTPLTKFVRTGEGVLVFAFNLAMLIVPIVSNALSPADAVKWAGIVNGVAVISRTGLKIVAQVSKATGIEPQQIGNLSAQPSTEESGDGDAVESPVVTPATDVVSTAPVSQSPVTGHANGAPDSAADATVSDEEEFASVPPATEEDDYGTAIEPASDDNLGDAPQLVGVGASGVSNPIVINGGEVS